MEATAPAAPSATDAREKAEQTGLAATAQRTQSLEAQLTTEISGRFKHGVRKAAQDAMMQAVRDAVAAIAAIALQDSSHISEANIPVGTEESVAVVTPPASPARPAVSPAM